ncbi:21005_t:CDS:2, partial [Gigaspora rosea]
MDNDKLQQVYQIIVQPANNKKINQTTLRQRLIDKVKQLPDNQLKYAIHLFDTMRYSKVPSEAGQDSDSLIQKNKALQKQVTQLEHTNAKKSYKMEEGISEIHITKTFNQSSCSEYFIFGIAADKLTRHQHKIFAF